MKDRIITGISFLVVLIVNSLLIFFLVRYESGSGSVALSRVYWVFLCVNGGYIIYYCITKLWDDFDLLMKTDLPIVIIATMPPLLLLLAFLTKCSITIRILICILWGIVSLLQVLTFVMRILKYDNSWSFFRMRKRDK